MLILLFSFLYSTKTYLNENKTTVTSIEFKKSKKKLYQENLTYIDQPIRISGGKNSQISIKKIETSKYILIDSVTVNVDELIIDDVDQYPFKIINGGKISIQNSLYISSNFPKKVFISKEVNNADTIEVSNSEYVVDTSDHNSKSYILHSATLSFKGNSFFANSIFGDSESKINLQEASSLTVETVEGDVTILCSNDRKTNLYISKPSNLTNLIIYNETDFFAINCTIKTLTVLSSNANSEVILLNLFDSILYIDQAKLSNCLIRASNAQLRSEIFNLKDAIFNHYDQLIENPSITIKDIIYEGNTTLSGKFILSLTGSVKQNTASNPLIILSDDISKFSVSNEIFVIINSAGIDASMIDFDSANLILLQSQETKLALKNLDSFSFIDSSSNSNNFDIEINNENSTNSNFYVSTIGNQKAVTLKIENNSPKIDFLTNLTNSGDLAVTVNSLLRSTIELNITESNSIEITELVNVFELNYFVQNSVRSVSFGSIDFNINEAVNDTFYLSYTLPSPSITKVTNFSTVLVHDVKEFPTFVPDVSHLIDLENCDGIELNADMAKKIKTARNSSITANGVTFEGTCFSDCNLTSSAKIGFHGGDTDPNDKTPSQIDVIECTEFSVKNYRPLFIGRIVEAGSGCSIVLTKSRVHITTNDNNLECKLTDDKSYVYINEFNASTYKVEGAGIFVIKNCEEIDDSVLTLSSFTGSLFIYNCQHINMTNNDENGLADLSQFLILSSEFTLDEPFKNIGFYNSTVYVSEDGIEIDNLVLYNTNIKSLDGINVTSDDDSKYPTLSVKNLLFNGNNVLNDLNLKISQTVNNMPNFYQQYSINKTVFSDLYNQESHSKITMIPSDDTKITFGIQNSEREEFSFGNNYEFSMFSFHGNSIMTNDTFQFLNFNYFFSNINFTDNNNKIVGNIKIADYPTVTFDSNNRSTITCPSNQKVVFVNEKVVSENHTIYAVSCSSSDAFVDEFIDSLNCTNDEFNSITCSFDGEDEIEIESSAPKVVASNVVFMSIDELNCDLNSIILEINNFNDAKLNLNISNNSDVTFYDKSEAVLKNLNMQNDSSLSIYRNIIDNTSLTMSKNCKLTVLDTYDEYYNVPAKKSNATGFLNLVSMSESSMNCDFKFNITTPLFSTDSCSFKNAEIFIEKEGKQEEEAYSLFDNTLVLINTVINVSKAVEKVHFANFQYNGKLNSKIVINGNANFTETVHVNGIINCPNGETVLDLTKADSDKIVILYNLQVNCSVNFSEKVSQKLHLGGNNSIIGKGTVFEPSNLAVFVEGRVHFFNFNQIDSVSYQPTFSKVIEESFIDDFYGRQEIILANYESNQVDFNITGQSNVTVLDDTITFTKSFETFNDSAIFFQKLIVFNEGATFNGHHVIECHEFESSSVTSVIWTNQSFVFNDFSSEGKTTVTVKSEDIVIKDSHSGNDEVLMESIQYNLLKLQQMYNIDSFIDSETEEEMGKTKIDYTLLDWQNINIISTSNFLIDLFTHHVINFHSNKIVFINATVKLYGGYIRNVNFLSAENSMFDVKDDYIESEKCAIKDSAFSSYMSAIGCSQLTTENVQFAGYVDLYRPRNIDMKNVTVNFSLPNDYPLFNIHNIIVDDEPEARREGRMKAKLTDDKNEEVTVTKDDDDYFDLKIRMELNVNAKKDPSYETAKLFMFDVMPNSLPSITTVETKGDKAEYLFNSEIVNNHIITFKSLKCGNNGEYDEDSKKCMQCPSGHYSYEDRCVESPEGKFINSQMKLNQDCPLGFYNDGKGRSECLKCPLHMTTSHEGSTSKSDCICDVGYMFDDSFSTNEDEKCVKCPEGLACNMPNTMITDVKILEGYFYYNKDYDSDSDKHEFNITDEDLTHHLNSSHIYKCLTIDNCLNPVQSTQRLTQCKKEYNGFLCSKCKKNYYHKSINICTKCSKFPIVALVFGPIIHVFFVWYCFFKNDKYCAFLYFFMLFTQHYVNIYGININWPTIFTYASIIFESINLDFRRFFDCETNDEVWSQGLVFMFINIAYTACFIVFFMFFLREYNRNSKNCCNCCKNNIDKSIDEQINDYSDQSIEQPLNTTPDNFDPGPIPIPQDLNLDASNYNLGPDPNSNANSNFNPNHNFNSNRNYRKRKCWFCRNNNEDHEKLSIRILQILTIYYFMTFLIQLRWLLSVMANKDGHLIVYPFIVLNSKDYNSHVVIILVNSIYFFGFLLFFTFFFFYLCFHKPVTVVLLMYKYVLYDVKYSFIFLPFVYILKSILMCFLVIYLNDNWYINIILIIVLVFCLDFFLYAQPFINVEIRQLESINLMFQIFIVAMGIMAQQIHTNFEIFSTVLMVIIIIIFTSLYVYFIKKYHDHYPNEQKKKNDYNNRDYTSTKSKKDVLIKYRNKCNRFFFYDEEFDLNTIFKWFFNMPFYVKVYAMKYLNRSLDKIKEDYKNQVNSSEDECDKINVDECCNDVKRIFNEHRNLFHSFYESRDSQTKEDICFLLNFINELTIDSEEIKKFTLKDAYNENKKDNKKKKKSKFSLKKQYCGLKTKHLTDSDDEKKKKGKKKKKNEYSDLEENYLDISDNDNNNNADNDIFSPNIDSNIDNIEEEEEENDSYFSNGIFNPHYDLDNNNDSNIDNIEEEEEENDSYISNGIFNPYYDPDNNDDSNIDIIEEEEENDSYISNGIFSPHYDPDNIDDSNIDNIEEEEEENDSYFSNGIFNPHYDPDNNDVSVPNPNTNNNDASDQISYSIADQNDASDSN